MACAFQVDGTVVVSAFDNSTELVNGVMGLLSSGTGWFDSVAATTQCDYGFQCLSALHVFILVHLAWAFGAKCDASLGRVIVGACAVLDRTL